MTDAFQQHAWRVMEQLEAPVLTLDLTGYLTSWNRGAEQLFGYSAQEAIGQHVLFLYDASTLLLTSSNNCHNKPTINCSMI